jgi:hypothetical protein
MTFKRKSAQELIGPIKDDLDQGDDVVFDYLPLPPIEPLEADTAPDQPDDAPEPPPAP